jgi:hypothetical protein
MFFTSFGLPLAARLSVWVVACVACASQLRVAEMDSGEWGGGSTDTSRRRPP